MIHCSFKIVPEWQTLNQRQNNIGSMSMVSGQWSMSSDITLFYKPFRRH